MSDVSTRTFGPLVRKLAERGVPVESWVEGLPLTVAQLQGSGTTIPWDVFVRLLDRVELVSGGLDAVEELAFEVAHAPGALWRRALRLAAGPIELYKLIVLWGRSVDLEGMTVRTEDLPGGRLRITSQIPESLLGSLPFWHAVKGSLRAVPCLLGLAEALVEAEITPHRAVFTVTPPQSASIASRVRRALRGLVSSRTLIEELARQQEELRASYGELRTAHSALQRQSDALRESEARYRALVEGTDDIVAVSDMHSQVRFVNEGITTLAGWRAEEWLGRAGTDLIHVEDRPKLRECYVSLLTQGTSPAVEFRLLRRDGGSCWVEGRASLFRTAAGEDRLVLIMRDIAERKRTELERQSYAAKLERDVARRTRELEEKNSQLRRLQTRLMAAERIGAARELGGRVAHSINNPLAALIGNLELMIESADTDTGLGRLLQLARRIQAVVQRTLELSREGALDLVLEDPAEILREVARELRERGAHRSIEIETKVPPGLPRVLVDRTLLISALLCIAENGVDAMESGGTLWLEGGALPGLGVLRISISDSGPGVPDGLRSKVFEPFFTTKPAGTGLGLAIAQGIIGGHEGRIVFAERSGGGAVATVELPLPETSRLRPRSAESSAETRR